jgi:AraC-like DNA-binding protein
VRSTTDNNYMKDTGIKMQAVIKNNSDLDDTCSKSGEVYRPHRLTLRNSKDPLQAKLELCGIDQTSISRLEYMAKMKVESESFDDFYLLMFPTSGEFHLDQSGIEGLATCTNPVILDTNKKIEMNWSEECSCLIYKVNSSLIDKTLHACYGIEAKRPVEFNTHASGTASFVELSPILNNFIINNPLLNSISDNEKIFEKIEEVMALSILSKENSYTEKIIGTKFPVQPRAVVKAKEFMEEHYSEKLTVLDIAGYVGISARSLQKSFERFECTTPTLYLRKLRLKRARELLVFASSQGEGIKISEIALRCGFFHFGNFSKLYAKEFGETPSQTVLSARY